MLGCCGGVRPLVGLVLVVRPTVLRHFPCCCLCLFLVFVLGPFRCWFLFGLFVTHFSNHWTSLPLLPGDLPLHGLLGICMSAQRVLLETARATVYGLRALADSLELALDRLDSEVPGPFTDRASDPAGSTWALVSEPAPATPPATPARVPSGFVPPSPTPTNYSTNSYHEVAAELTRAPDFCLALCSRLALGSPSAIERRAQRAWEAGLWAKATLEGRIQKPRPSPKLDLKAEVYIIVRAPGLDHPVRVSTAAEYFRIIPSFRNSNSISHSFPSIAEARVYCAAIGIAFPDQQ